MSMFCFAPKVTCTGSGSCRFCCCLVTVGGGVSPDVWPQLSDTPGGLTDSRGGMNGASPPTSQKDALLGSNPNKPSPPSSPSSRGQKEVSTVSESVQEPLSSPPQEAAPEEEQSQSEPPKKKKDPVGENYQVQLSIHLSPSLPSPLIVRSHTASSVFMPHAASGFDVSVSHSTRFDLITLSESPCGVRIYALFLGLRNDKMFTEPFWMKGSESGRYCTPSA